MAPLAKATQTRTLKVQPKATALDPLLLKSIHNLQETAGVADGANHLEPRTLLSIKVTPQLNTRIR